MKRLAAILIVFLLLLSGCGERKQSSRKSSSPPSSPLAATAPPATPERFLGVIQRAHDLEQQARREGNGAYFRQAEAMLQDALEVDPRNDAVMVALGEILYAGGDITGIAAGDWEAIEARSQQARDLFAQALQINPRNAQAYFGLAMYYAVRETAKAIDLYRHSLELDPNNNETRFNLGKCYYELGRYAEAENIFRGMLNGLDPDDRGSEFIRNTEYLGRLYAKQGRYDEAEKLLRDSVAGLEAFDVNRDAYWGCPYQALGELYSQTGQQTAAAEHYRKAADQEYFKAHVQFDAAKQCYRAGDLANAQTYIRRALAISPDRFPYKWFARWIRLRLWWLSIRGGESRTADLAMGAEFEAALAAFDAGDYPGARQYLNQALKTAPRAPYLTLQGYLLLFAKQYSEAEASFRKALTIDAQDVGAGVGLGHLANIRHDYPAASAAFDTALTTFTAFSTDPATWRDPARKYERAVFQMACLGLGWVQANQNRHEQAIAAYDRILAQAPDDLMALLGKGNSLSGLHRLAEAEAIFTRVLARHPDNQYALAEMALVKYNRGDDRAAEEAFKKALTQDGQQYTCPYEGLGLIYLRQGRLDAAKQNFEKAIAINPNIEYKKFNGLAKIYLREGRVDEARKLLEKSVENYPYDNEARELLAGLESR